MEKLYLEPRVVYTPKEVEVVKYVTSRLGDPCEKIHMMENKHTSRMVKYMMMAILSLNNKASKFSKTSYHCSGI